MKRGFDRTQRIGDLIHQSLAPMLLQSDDKRFHFVTVTGVTVSRDLSYAKIYVSTLIEDEAEVKQTLLALNRATKSFRYALAREVDLRIVPELKFYYDESTARGFHLSNLIDAAVKK